MVDGPVREGHETVGVVVATYGDEDEWTPLAKRAVESAMDNTIEPNFTIHVHRMNLAGARNYGLLKMLNMDWVIFLDADDELDPHYIEHMLAAQGDIRQPSTLGVHPDGHEDDYPVLIPPHPGGYMVGNHLIIGCMVRRDLALAVGGFRDLPSLEDWDFWIRCQLEGARVGAAPEAIYRVHVRPQSRNKDERLHGRVYADIQQRYQFDWQLKGLR